MNFRFGVALCAATFVIGASASAATFDASATVRLRIASTQGTPEIFLDAVDSPVEATGPTGRPDLTASVTREEGALGGLDGDYVLRASVFGGPGLPPGAFAEASYTDRIMIVNFGFEPVSITFDYDLEGKATGSYYEILAAIENQEGQMVDILTGSSVTDGSMLSSMDSFTVDLNPFDPFGDPDAIPVATLSFSVRAYGVSPVPLPAAAPMLLAAVAGLAALGRRARA